MLRPLWYVKRSLLFDFEKWTKEVPTRNFTPRDMIEFLVQKKLLSGRRFNRYIDNLPELSTIESIEYCEPLTEGFIPPRTWIGKKKKNTH